MKDFIKKIFFRILSVIAFLILAYGNAFSEHKEVECYVGEKISVTLPQISGYKTPEVTAGMDYQYVSVSNVGYLVSIKGLQSTGRTQAKITADYYAVGNTKPRTQYFILVKVKAVPIRIDQSNVTLNAGESTRLTYSATVSSGTKPESVTWSSNNGCASVDKYSGEVTGNYGGDATITATTSDGESATCRVHVNPVDQQSVEVDPLKKTIYIDESSQLKATVYPREASQSVKWYVETGKSQYMSVSSSGYVTGKAVGSGYVYAEIQNGARGSCYVTVEEPPLTQSNTSPSSGATGLSVFIKPSVTFSHNIYSSTNYSSITLKDSKGNVVKGTTSISGKSVTFSPSHPLGPQTKYTLTIPANAVKNQWGTDYKKSVTLSFTTSDLEKLTLSATANDRFLAVGDQITLTCNKWGATIYYTVDGTTPTESSLKYSKAIEMKQDFRLRAFATLEGYANSDMVDLEYHLTNAEIVSKFPNEEMLAVYKDVNPNVRFSNKVKASSKIESIALQSTAGEEIACEIIVSDSSVYLIPSKEFEIGSNYTVTIPADAVKTKDGESNKKYSWTFSTGDFATSISMGAYELGTAIKKDASLITWGARYYSGNEATWNVQFKQQAVPATFLEKDVVASSSGYMHYAAVKTDGTLWMWGRQYCGEFGNGSTTASPTPVKIMSNVRSVSAGGQHTAIIKTDNTMWMCGRNDFGQIGNGTYDVCKSAVKVMEGVSSCAAGWCVTLAVTESGELYAWGRNDRHQLGDGSDSLRLKPVKILDDVAIAEASPTESGYFAAIKTDGTLWIWGDEIAVPECRASDVCAVAVGTDYVMYVTTDGNLHAWGGNGFGQLGTGNLDSAETPVLVMTGVADVATGGQTTMAIKDDGSVWTWGRNYAGNLGQENTTPSNTAYESTPACIIEGFERGRLQGLYCRKNLAIVINGVAVAEIYPVPLNAVYETLEWSSSDPNVASVTDRGVVFAEGRGNADITCTATCADGTKASAICHVFVGTQEEIDVGIDDVLADGGNFKVWCQDKTIYISGMDTGTNVCVYNTSGLELFRTVADSTTMRIPMNTSGVFIVNVGKAIYKILCR